MKSHRVKAVAAVIISVLIVIVIGLGIYFAVAKNLVGNRGANGESNTVTDVISATVTAKTWPLPETIVLHDGDASRELSQSEPEFAEIIRMNEHRAETAPQDRFISSMFPPDELGELYIEYLYPPSGEGAHPERYLFPLTGTYKASFVRDSVNEAEYADGEAYFYRAFADLNLSAELVKYVKSAVSAKN